MKNKLNICFEVVTNYNMSIEEAASELLAAEILLNSSSTKLRFHLTDVTLKDIKTFLYNPLTDKN